MLINKQYAISDGSWSLKKVFLDFLISFVFQFYKKFLMRLKKKEIMIEIRPFYFVIEFYLFFLFPLYNYIRKYFYEYHKKKKHQKEVRMSG